jgi:UDP-N-acetylglucosamine 2-epimerase (non-hydrolysing)
MDLGMRKTIVCTIGTRPEAIKMKPVIQTLQAAPWAQCRVVLTGQHRELATDVLDAAAIEADIDLDVLRLGLAFDRLARYLVKAMTRALKDVRPDFVLAQGDTTSVVATAIASFRTGVPFGHVEAGLRTNRLCSPFPEEINRVVTSHLSTLHFAPTWSARENLEREGIRSGAIHVTGNTVIDALLATARKRHPIGVELDANRRLVLVTAHRRDCFGEPLKQICSAVEQLADLERGVEFLWPVHPNPAIKHVVEGLLQGQPRVHLCGPLSYESFVAAMRRATLILTDSGGVQEEAPALGTPVLVMRNESERPEAIAAGVAKLVGHDPRTIVEEARRLLNDPAAHRSMARGMSPYGDGRAAARIIAILRRFLAVRRRLRASA